MKKSPKNLTFKGKLGTVKGKMCPETQNLVIFWAWRTVFLLSGENMQDFGRKEAVSE